MAESLYGSVWQRAPDAFVKDKLAYSVNGKEYFAVGGDFPDFMTSSDPPPKTSPSNIPTWAWFIVGGGVIGIVGLLVRRSSFMIKKAARDAEPSSQTEHSLDNIEWHHGRDSMPISDPRETVGRINTLPGYQAIEIDVNQQTLPPYQEEAPESSTRGNVELTQEAASDDNQVSPVAMLPPPQIQQPVFMIAVPSSS
ncbi:hypothetical protein HDU97_004093 [Phlyctochytrium planicorne]|nr:hypothetical protein HDU97_004093 [Phlyctochytrium planicorne]